MAEFKKLADVESLTEIPEGANAFIEVDGVIKKVPGEGLGGGNVPYMLTLKISINSDETMNHIRVLPGNDDVYYGDELTFGDAAMMVFDGYLTSGNIYIRDIYTYTTDYYAMLSIKLNDYNYTEDCIIIKTIDKTYYWTESGFSSTEPEAASSPS